MATKDEFLRDLVKDERTLRKVCSRVERVIKASFAADRASRIVLLVAASPTEAEVKRRTNICYDWFARLRVDLHYSTERALDTLPRALRATLDGEAWEPPLAERAWGPAETR
jgi:hypothetical protein